MPSKDLNISFESATKKTQQTYIDSSIGSCLSSSSSSSVSDSCKDSKETTSNDVILIKDIDSESSSEFQSSSTSTSSSTQFRNLNYCSNLKEQKRSAIPSELFSEIENMNWKNALKRMESHPSEGIIWENVRIDTNCNTTYERLPLHHACLKLRVEMNTNSYQILLALQCIEKLVQIYPESLCTRESRHGCLPLHLMAYSCSNKKKEVKAWRSFGKQCSSSSRSLMVGILPGDDEREGDEIEETFLKIISEMIKLYAKALKVDSEGGRLPLHIACSSKASTQSIQMLLKAYPSAARHRTREMCLPLHLVATWGVSHPDVAITLLRAYPDAALGLNRYGRTPLEEALFVAGEVGRQNQMELIRILRKHPTFWTSRLGRSIVNYEDFKLANKSAEHEHPLMHLISTRDWASVLHRLANFPEEADIFVLLTNRAGRTIRYTPLHYICEHHPPVNVVKALLALNSSALSLNSSPGSYLPLHLTCQYSSDSSLLQLLLTLNPAGLTSKDEMGNLPLHLMCYNPKCGLDMLQHVVSLSKSVFATNNAGSTAIDIIRRKEECEQKECFLIYFEKYIDRFYPDHEDSCVADHLIWI